ncbi:MAG: HAD family hydrolase [Planctomycetota bacterium]|jgi:phosphoserine phosphatase|nr:HAD family hydrolase [Planctomycetota bacterium]
MDSSRLDSPTVGAAKPTVAFVYDFDGTLARDNIQEHSLLRALGEDVGEFWNRVEENAQASNADQILMYLFEILRSARSHGVKLTSEMLEEHGRNTPLLPGVEAWFDRIDAFARELGLEPVHYIVSSGNEEMIRGTAIAHRFRYIFACKYLFDDQGEACWPSVVVNYTTKTQFLFRINKGIENFWDDQSLNRWMEKPSRPVPFERMIFFGDGDTDIPAMKMTREQGGYSVAVFDPDKWAQSSSREKVHKLISEDRVSYVVSGDYNEDSLLDATVKGILSRIGRQL